MRFVHDKSLRKNIELLIEKGKANVAFDHPQSTGH